MIWCRVGDTGSGREAIALSLGFVLQHASLVCGVIECVIDDYRVVIQPACVVKG